MINDNPNRNMPFLHRNWRVGIESCQSKWGVSPGRHRTAGPGLDKADGDHQDQHRAKRLKTNGNTPIKEQQSVTDFDRYLLAQDPRDHPKLLRIDVLKLVHKDAIRTKFNTTVPVTDLTRSKARCRITVSYDRMNVFKQPTAVVLHSESRMCEVISFTHSLSATSFPEARITLPQPIIISREQIQILHEDDYQFDWADNYTITLELESASSDPWPPLNLGSLQTDEDRFHKTFFPVRQWVMCASHFGLKGSISRIPLELRRHPDRSDRRTDYLVELDMKWTTTPTRTLTASKQMDYDLSSTIVALGGRVDGLSALLKHEAKLDSHRHTYAAESAIGSPRGGLTNGHRPNGTLFGTTNGAISDTMPAAANMVVPEDGELVDGELTPNRSMRARANNVVYNLKKLSDRAHGTEKEPKKRQRNGQPKPSTNEGEGCRVLYSLPAEQVAIEGFVCCVCAVTTENISQLRAHFLNHPYYSFEYQQRPGKNSNVVQIKRVSELPPPPLRPGVYQLGRAIRPFDLEKYLSGDDSWVKSRLGPDNEDEVELPIVRVPQKLGNRRRAAKPVVVPNTKQPLFDAVSKVLLKPGSLYRTTPMDYSWQIQKHREVIQDYSDLNSEEKEFIQEWDAFIIAKHITSDAHICQAHVAFAKAKASWLLAKPSRMQEFGKRTSVLLSRSVLDEASHQEAMACIADARAQHASKPPPALEPVQASASATVKKSKKGCGKCGLPVLGLSQLVCSNKKCRSRRLFHDRCLSERERPNVNSQGGYEDAGSWRCPSCASK